MHIVTIQREATQIYFYNCAVSTYDGPGQASMLHDQGLHARDCIPSSLEEIVDA